MFLECVVVVVCGVEGFIVGLGGWVIFFLWLIIFVDWDDCGVIVCDDGVVVVVSIVGVICGYGVDVFVVWDLV